jgi:hypothetical protein
MGFVWFLVQRGISSLSSINQLIFVMVKCGVLFEVRTELLNNIWTTLWLQRVNIVEDIS